jgi:hypothetical protein
MSTIRIQKKSIASIFLIAMLALSCSKQECVVCIAESHSGNIIKVISECDKSESYLQGFIDGVNQYYQDYRGDTTNVHCSNF